MDEPARKERKRMAKLRELLKQSRSEADRQTLRFAIVVQQRALALALRAPKGK